VASDAVGGHEVSGNYVLPHGVGCRIEEGIVGQCTVKSWKPEKLMTMEYCQVTELPWAKENTHDLLYNAWTNTGHLCIVCSKM
jgi:hypothetical protein